jgi:hypothetical protein
VFGQHSAESAICCLGVRYVCSQGGLIIGLCSPRCQFRGSSYLLRAVSIVLEVGGENSSFWMRESWSQRALAVCIREARTGC